METTVLIGRGGKIEKAPESTWEQELAKAPRFFASRLAFMTQDHHRVRNFVVSELPRNQGEPLRPEVLSRKLGMQPAKLDQILGDLERNLFFLVRDEAGAVLWAFPVTAAQTPHLVRFKSGESSFAAWAIDAIATPFVEGRIWKKGLQAEVETACAHCGQPIHLSLTSKLDFTVRENTANPLVFAPDIDWENFHAPHITGDL